MDCEILPSFVNVPNEFLLADVKFEDDHGFTEARLLLLPSSIQRDFLRRASTWYLDGTFKAADNIIFKQAFGIHAFSQCGENLKQVPLLIVLMSRRSKKDYEAVFSELARHLGAEIKLEDCLLDFEIATWISLRSVFPWVIYGCMLHFV